MWTYLCGHTGTAREETDRAREVRIETLSSNDEREQQPNYIRGLDPDHPGFAVTACRCRSSASTGLHRLPGQACVDRWVGTRQISLSLPHSYFRNNFREALHLHCLASALHPARTQSSSSTDSVVGGRPPFPGSFPALHMFLAPSCSHAQERQRVPSRPPPGPLRLLPLRQLTSPSHTRLPAHLPARECQSPPPALLSHICTRTCMHRRQHPLASRQLGHQHALDVLPHEGGRGGGKGAYRREELPQLDVLPCMK